MREKRRENKDERKKRTKKGEEKEERKKKRGIYKVACTNASTFVGIIGQREREESIN